MAILSATDGGSHWQTIAKRSSDLVFNAVTPDFLAFGSASSGWWLAPPDTLTKWSITDSGYKWSQSTF